MKTIKMETKIVLRHNHQNGDYYIISEFDSIQQGFEAFQAERLEDLEDGYEEIELIRLEENGLDKYGRTVWAADEWMEDELESIGYPLNSWIIK